MKKNCSTIQENQLNQVATRLSSPTMMKMMKMILTMAPMMLMMMIMMMMMMMMMKIEVEEVEVAVVKRVMSHRILENGKLKVGHVMAEFFRYTIAAAVEQTVLDVANVFLEAFCFRFNLTPFKTNFDVSFGNQIRSAV